MRNVAARVLAISAAMCWFAAAALVSDAYFSFANLLPILLALTFTALVLLVLRAVGPPQVLAAHAGLTFFCWHWTQPRHMQELRHHEFMRLALVLSLVAALLGVISLLIKAMPRAMRLWSLVVLACSTSVALLSSPAGGAQGWAEWLSARLGLALYQADTIVSMSRESIHFLFYAFFAYAGYRFARAHSAHIGAAAGFAVLAAMAHGAFDEIRQSYLPQRSGHAADILLDVAGAASAVYVLSIIDRRRQSRLAAGA